MSINSTSYNAERTACLKIAEKESADLISTDIKRVALDRLQELFEKKALLCSHKELYGIHLPPFSKKFESERPSYIYLLPHVAELQNRQAMFAFFDRLPENRKSLEMLSRILPLFQTAPSETDQNDILKFFDLMPPEETPSEEIFRILFGQGNLRHTLILQKELVPLLERASKNQRTTQMVTKLLSLLSPIDPTLKPVVLSLFSSTPNERLGSLVKYISTLSSENQIKSFCRIARLLPPEYRLAPTPAIEGYHNFSTILSNRLSSDARLAQLVHDYLSREFGRIISLAEEVRMLAQSVVDLQVSLHLHREHPVVQEALEILCITDPDRQNDIKNPYRVYKTLENEDSLWNGDRCVRFLAGEEKMPVNLDLEGLRRAPRKEFKRSDVIDTPSVDLFNVWFSRPDSSQEEAVMNFYENSPSELKNNLVNGVVIRNLLDLPSDPDAPITNASFYLCTIMRHVSQLDHAPEPGELFSRRERALFSFAHSLRSCKTGQIDAITLYYNHLIKEFHLNAPPGETSSETKLNHFLHSVMQSTLNDVFANREFLRLVGGEEALVQESHQTLYVKNKLFKQVGLHHQLTFDAHTHCLSGELLQTSRYQLMQIFFLCCTPKKLIENLQKEVFRALKDPTTGILIPLTDFFDLYIREGRGNKEDFLQYDDRSDCIELTRSGAFLLLQQAGFLYSEKTDGILPKTFDFASSRGTFPVGRTG